MSERDFQGIELLPATLPVRQLFILLHGAGRTPPDMLPLAETLGAAFPQAAFLLPEGIAAFDGDDSGRQWFSLDGVNDDNRAARVAAAMPALHALIRQAQDRLKVMQPDTALVGFSQGAIMALEYGIAHDARRRPGPGVFRPLCDAARPGARIHDPARAARKRRPGHPGRACLCRL
ncbi:alpha/beta hydrolase family protein [Thiobacillus sp.]